MVKNTTAGFLPPRNRIFELDDYMNILGLKIYGHDTGAALIANGKIVAIAEERLNRVKHSFNMYPALAIEYCLKAHGLNASQVNLVVIDQVGHRSEVKIREMFEKHAQSMFAHARVEVINHHDAHAASAFFASPFEEAAVLIYDGSGEKFLTHHGVYATETETLYQGKGNVLTSLQKTTHPRKGTYFPYTFGIGKLYSFLSSFYLGFGPYNEGKMMGLAPFGDLSLFEKIPEREWWTEVHGHVVCNSRFIVPRRFKNPLIRPFLSFAVSFWQSLKEMGAQAFVVLYAATGVYARPNLFKPIRLPRPPRAKTDKLPDHYYASVARAGQHILEQVALRWGKRLKEFSNSENLCIAGGVGLNIDANKNFLDVVGFKNIFVQPASSDTGIALGCALWGHHMILGLPRFYTMTHASLGRPYTEDEIQKALEGVKEKISIQKSANVAGDAAKAIADGKIIGWFYGGSEYGPRALGHRSILCDARQADMKDVLNHRVKHREGWRPFATAMLLEKLSEYFDIEHPSPFMLLAAKVRPEKKSLVPSVIHVDDTSRIQTVTKKDNGRYHDLIKAFYDLTGVPIILNTSYNLGGDPIVETPEDALDTFLRTNLDVLFLEEYVVTKK